MLIDLSRTLNTDSPVYPGDPPVDVRVLAATPDAAVGGDDASNVSQMSFSLHAGTHMDAPFHFFGKGQTIDGVPLERCFGEAVLLDLREPLQDNCITPEHLSAREREIREARRVIVQTGWSDRWGQPEYFLEHPVISEEAAKLLVDYDVVLVGVDFPSVDREPFASHRVLLGAEVLIVENLTNLEQIPTSPFLFVALPLKLEGRDGSPVRAIGYEIGSRPPGASGKRP